MISQTDIDFYKENGYFLAKGVFTESEVEDMREAVDAIIRRAAGSKYDKNHVWQGDYLGDEDVRKLVLKGFHDVHFHHAAFTRAAIHPRMADIVRGLIGPNVMLHHSKMLVKPPEKGAAFPLHQDYPYFPHANHTMTAASVYLDDATEENGAIGVIPGSHKLGPLPHVGRHYLDHREYPISRATICCAEKGDVLFFNYLTVHGSNANRSPRPRRNVLFQYRDPLDPPTVDTHVDWGMGLMIAGENADYFDFRARMNK